MSLGHRLPLQSILAGIVLLIGVITWAAYKDATQVEPEDSASESPADKYWRGDFYHNADDSSLFVEKRWGIGTTLNYAHKGAWVITAAILLPVLGLLLGY